MIRVTFYENPDNVILRCTLKGHAGYADKGQDIVCSAVSMLFINTANSIEAFASDKFSMKTDARKNQYDFSFLEHPSKEAQLLMNSLMLGLNSVHDQYGSDFLKITLKEVQ
ncbi:MAG: ribosomal-processing cysteine protease Prp [Lachnospiraceae bacterium]|nr:ribosomal-processing cysteine protease Prp [Lachnospiraceae bacterium]